VNAACRSSYPSDRASVPSRLSSRRVRQAGLRFVEDFSRVDPHNERPAYHAVVAAIHRLSAAAAEALAAGVPSEDIRPLLVKRGEPTPPHPSSGDCRPGRPAIRATT
jgi:hypothetical protein